MRKLTTLVVASTLAMGAFNMAHAADTTSAAATPSEKPMMHHGKWSHGFHQEKMFKGLHLTEAQKQQMNKIMQDSRSKMQSPTPDERRAMHDLIASDSFDSAKAGALIDKDAATNKARMLAHLESQNKMYNVLTAEQKKQYNANFEKHLTEGPMHKGKHLKEMK